MCVDAGDVRTQLRERPRPRVWTLLAYYWPHIRKQWPIFLAAWIALMLSVLLRIMDPWPLKYIFDHILGSDRASSSSLAPWASAEQWVAALAGAVVVIAVARALTRHASQLWMSVATGRVLGEVRNDLFRHLQRISPDTLSRFGTGDVANRLTGDIEKLREVCTSTALQFTNNAVSMVGMLAVMFWIHWQLALIAAAFLPVFYWFGARMAQSIRQVARSQRQAEGEVTQRGVEALNALKAVQALGLGSVFARRFQQQSDLHFDAATEAVRRSSLLQRGVLVLFAVCLASVLWRGSQLVLEQAMTPGELLVFIAYLGDALEKPATRLTLHAARFAQAAAAAERIYVLFAQVPAVKQAIEPTAASHVEGAIELERVSFGYGDGRVALSDISLRIAPGQRVVLVGPSGSGKSTLLSMLLRLQDPTTGRVLVDGRDLRQYGLDAYRRAVSVVLQESMLFKASVRENVLYGRPDATQTELDSALCLADASGFVAELPDGAETVLSEGARSLSGGERQRLAIARAAIRDAPIVLLDEPTAGLDAKSQATVNRALARLSQGRTTVMVSHELAQFADSDLIVFMHGGRIVERGTHCQLLSNDGPYARMFHTQIPTYTEAEAPDAQHA